MADVSEAPFPAARDVSVSFDESWRIVSVRYFEASGALGAALHEALGSALPPPLARRMPPAPAWLLAWRSPQETWCLTREPLAAAALIARLAGLTDGYAIDLSSAVAVLRISGEGGSGLLARLTGPGGLPAVSEARASRLADVAVLVLAPASAEWLLVVDRAYRTHLCGWIRRTLEDLQP
jgi:heterotetrameric sarcosine oxidase gamma subunit